MNRNVILTCAVTGAGDTTGKNPNVPVTPRQIADNCIEAARAGASVAHIHVRDPETGGISHSLDHFREVMERVRESDTDIVMNITAGGGGDWIPDATDPTRGGPAPTSRPQPSVTSRWVNCCRNSAPWTAAA